MIQEQQQQMIQPDSNIPQANDNHNYNNNNDDEVIVVVLPITTITSSTTIDETVTTKNENEIPVIVCENINNIESAENETDVAIEQGSQQRQQTHQTQQQLTDEIKNKVEKTLSSRTDVWNESSRGFIRSDCCCICLDDFQENETLTALPRCIHFFHTPIVFKNGYYVEYASPIPVHYGKTTIKSIRTFTR